MATPETALLADFDFDLTSNANATPLVPRPPTPDPRRTPTPHPPRRSKPPTLATDTAPKRLRRKPTAIFIGSEPKGQDVAARPCQGEAQPFHEFARPSHHTLPSLLPLLPSTPSPRFASSPSLSSSATTVQSSPTLTPTTPHFASSYSEPQADTRGFEAFNTWDYNKGTLGLRRAKRLPHREQGLWEVHAVVHVGEHGRECGSSSGIGQGQGEGQDQGQSSHKHYEWCMQQQRQAGILATSLPPESVATRLTTERSSAQEKPPVIQNNATPRNAKLESFHGILSESTRREGGLRKTQTGESSNFSLSKYQFPAPPGDYRVGLSDNYFEDPAAMPRAFYTDAESARRDIMRLGEVEEAAPADTSSHESSVPSLVPTRVRSDPFDLRVTDVPSQATQTVRNSAAGASTISDIVEGYDYTRETPFENELTLRALESGSVRKEHSEEMFRQFSEEIQQHVSAGLSAMASEMPTSDQTYGDTGQLLGLTPRQPHQYIPPTTMPSSAPNAASGQPTTGRATAESKRPGAAFSLFCDSSDPDPHSSQKARGEILADPTSRDISSNTVQSDGEGDWETTRSESRAEIHLGLPRPSVESYANTSTYDENNRLSAMSDATVAGSQSYRPYRVALTLPLMVAESHEEDVKRARKALKKIYKDKVLEQSMIAGMVEDQTVSKETHRKDRGIFQGLRDRRKSAILQAHDNDIELEEIRKKNPQAVRLAADQIYAENASGQLTPQRAPMPLGKLRNVFNRSKSTADQLADRDIMDEVMAADDSRNLLAATPTTIFSSHLAFSESANTFRTFRDEEYTLSPLEYKSRAALDLGARPYSPAIPAATYSPDQSLGRRPNQVSESHRHGRAKAPRKPARRAAMSSQTSLRALITTGSPTSNIQGAFTDREMAEASRRWDLLPRHHNYYSRTQGRNASGPFPRFHDAPFHPANPQGRMLMRPGEVMGPRTLLLQERLSKRFFMRILAFPPLCFLYYSGHYDYWIANKSDGKVKAMSPSRKEDALSWAVLLSIVYCLIIIGIVVSVAIVKEN
ncbi:hypothetical protein MBLNU13_g01278t2 [Cladosporium sp. NU13]